MKNLAVVLLLLFFIFTIGIASETRVFSMGQTGLYLHDNSNTAIFPGTIMYYGNEVVTELRLKDLEESYSAEVRIPVQSKYVVGMNVNRPLYLTLPPLLANVELNETSDLYLATKLAGKNVGFRISLGRDGFKQDSSQGVQKMDESARYLEFGVGVSDAKYDLAASIALPKIKAEQGNTTEEWSGTGFSFIGRYFHRLDEKMHFVPVIHFSTSSSSQTIESSTSANKAEADHSLSSFSIGGGLHYKVNEKNLIILAIDPFGYYKTKTDIKDGTETTTTTTTLPRLYIGCETRLKSWLVGRLGANRAYQTVTTKTKPAGGVESEQSSQNSPYNVSFGLGIKVGKFLIDLDINDGLLFEGPNFISGRTRDMVNRVSVSYLFSNVKGGKK